MRARRRHRRRKREGSRPGPWSWTRPPSGLGCVAFRSPADGVPSRRARAAVVRVSAASEAASEGSKAKHSRGRTVGVFNARAARMILHTNNNVEGSDDTSLSTTTPHRRGRAASIKTDEQSQWQRAMMHMQASSCMCALGRPTQGRRQLLCAPSARRDEIQYTRQASDDALEPTHPPHPSPALCYARLHHFQSRVQGGKVSMAGRTVAEALPLAGPATD